LFVLLILVELCILKAIEILVDPEIHVLNNIAMKHLHPNTT